MSNTPERIYGWLDTQLSIARHYGGITYNGKKYVIAKQEEGQPLVREDVLNREKRAKGGVAMSEQKEQCWCRHCETERLKPLPMMDRIFERSFIVCPDCGNKRCPKATCHGHKCGSSNDSGQTGSEYGIETCAACHQSATQGEVEQ